MSIGRVLSSCVASLAVAGCAIVAVNMSRAPDVSSADPKPTASTSVPSARPAHLAIHLAPPRTPSRPAGSTARPTTAQPSTPASRPAVHHAVASTSRAPAPSSPKPQATPTSPAAPRAAPSAAPKPAGAPRGHALPLRYTTGSATRVITVTAHSYGSTTATLQAWTKASGGGWWKYGSPVTAHVGSDGLSTHPSETRSATPVGSFTLTQAFGHYSDPGTALPYIHTTPDDWWISQSGPLYNTHQRCSSHCAFTRGSPNEHLFYETPYYNYAVVINYNTRNAPGGVHQGAGSAFFLHVTDGAPTAGCVAIPQSKLVSIMRWLRPAAHPRILIGVT
jgi:L,D-peptidoglycan transpeptidase YkuD (ErfK/YbiS/YcfS/YnhG family)